MPTLTFFTSSYFVFHMERVHGISEAGRLPSQGLCLNGSAASFKEMTNGAPPGSDHSLRPATPTAAALSFPPARLPTSFRFSEFHPNTPGALGLGLLYRLGLFTSVPSGTKCKRLSTGPNVVPPATQTKEVWPRSPAPNLSTGSMESTSTAPGSGQPGRWALIAGRQLPARDICSHG